MGGVGIVHTEKRQFERRQSRFRIRVETVNGAAIDEDASISEVSIGGFRLETDSSLDVGACYCAELFAYGRKEALTFSVLEKADVYYRCEIQTMGDELFKAVELSDDLSLLAIKASRPDGES